MARDCPNAGGGGGSRACHKVYKDKSTLFVSILIV